MSEQFGSLFYLTLGINTISIVASIVALIRYFQYFLDTTDTHSFTDAGGFKCFIDSSNFLGNDMQYFNVAMSALFIAAIVNFFVLMVGVSPTDKLGDEDAILIKFASLLTGFSFVVPIIFFIIHSVSKDTHFQQSKFARTTSTTTGSGIYDYMPCGTEENPCVEPTVEATCYDIPTIRTGIFEIKSWFWIPFVVFWIIAIISQILTILTTLGKSKKDLLQDINRSQQDLLKRELALG